MDRDCPEAGKMNRKYKEEVSNKFPCFAINSYTC